MTAHCEEDSSRESDCADDYPDNALLHERNPLSWGLFDLKPPFAIGDKHEPIVKHAPPKFKAVSMRNPPLLNRVTGDFSLRCEIIFCRRRNFLIVNRRVAD